MKRSKGKVLAVVGAQYGSEGKGVIVNRMAMDYGVHVRIGGPNAGHSFYHKGILYKMQSIPCGWTNPDALCVLGRGGLVDLDQVCKELDWITKVYPGFLNRFQIDERAGVLDKRHHAIEGGVQGELHQKIGSTGEGVGAARIARISRDPERFSFAGDVIRNKYPELAVCLSPDTAENIRMGIAGGVNVLLEGTQGSALSLIHGPWPYVTSADTNAAQFAADVGLAPRLVDRTMLVVRHNPIRVAGNSGPLKGEMTWDEMSRRLGRTVIEQTTVTKKVRRVGEWDPELFMAAVKLNMPTSLAFTFADYLDPSVAGVTMASKLTKKVMDFVEYLENLSGVPVKMVGTGGDEWKTVDLMPGTMA